MVNLFQTLTDMKFDRTANLSSTTWRKSRMMERTGVLREITEVYLQEEDWMLQLLVNELTLVHSVFLCNAKYEIKLIYL